MEIINRIKEKYLGLSTLPRIIVKGIVLSVLSIVITGNPIAGIGILVIHEGYKLYKDIK